MSIQEVSPEKLAEVFHHYQHSVDSNQAVTSTVDAEAWENVPQQDKNRLVAAARLTLLELASTEEEENHARRYYAKPGEAEWGC